jgi:hypothetical protein
MWGRLHGIFVRDSAKVGHKWGNFDAAGFGSGTVGGGPYENYFTLSANSGMGVRLAPFLNQKGDSGLKFIYAFPPMGKHFSIIASIFVGLARLALVLAVSAARRGETMVIVLLVAALLLWKRSQRIL